MNHDPESITNPATGKKWLIEGVLFGMLFMLQGSIEFAFYNILIGVVIYVFGGLIYGLFMKLYLNKRGKPSEVN